MDKATSKRKKMSSGLTPVEVVIAAFVVALLLSILMPALARIKTAAQEETECKANLRQVGIVIQMSLQENDFKLPVFNIDSRLPPTYYPGAGNIDNLDGIRWLRNVCGYESNNAQNVHLWTTDGRESSPRWLPTQSKSYWGTAFNEYVKDINIFRCAAISQFAEMLANDLIYAYALHPSVDPKDVVEQASFGLNGFVGGGLNVNSLRNQAEVIVCTDHVEPRTEQAHDVGHGDMFCMGADIRNLSHFRPEPGNPRGAHYRAIFRHNIRNDKDSGTGGRASVLWLDGRVTTIEETYGKNVPNRWYDPRGIWLNIQ